MLAAILVTCAKCNTFREYHVSNMCNIFEESEETEYDNTILTNDKS